LDTVYRFSALFQALDQLKTIKVKHLFR